MILATGAAVVAVQEIDRFWARSGSVDQAEILGRLTGMHMSFHPTFSLGDSEYGIGLLSLNPLETHFVPLPRRGTEEPRGLITTRLNGLGIVATHLTQVDGARPPQIERVLEVAESLEPPVVLMGDFNATRRGLSALVEAGFSTGRKLTTTLPRVGWGRQIDLIWAGKGAQILDSYTLMTAASDHLPLIADLST